MKNILLADPDTGIRSSVSMLLKEHYAVYTASTGTQVLDLIQNENIDLLILDTSLKGIYPTDLLKTIKETTPSLPVIVMYVYLDEQQHTGKYIRNVANACVVKPFRNDSLIKTIDTLTHTVG